jgi:RNA polymerase sigma-70 factor (ECF subfamily)
VSTDYEQYRPLLFSIAYRMTGSVSDAEDLVQETFSRMLSEHVEPDNPKAYLATVTTRLAINQLKSARVRRESYVGSWLPEPLVDGRGPGLRGPGPMAPGPEEYAEMADSLSMAFLVILEALNPTERAVFLLHEVFGYEHAEIAAITGKSEPACRQILARARKHVNEGKPRFEASREQREQVSRRFFEAAGGGDLDALLQVLAPDVVFVGDGGGRAQAIATPMFGSKQVARFLAGLFRRGQAEHVSISLAEVNGQPGAVVLDAHGAVISVFSLDIAAGMVQAIRTVVNPDKLRHLGEVSTLALRPEQDLPLPDAR